MRKQNHSSKLSALVLFRLDLLFCLYFPAYSYLVSIPNQSSPPELIGSVLRVSAVPFDASNHVRK